jgi:sec-independent protein translocase protein TatB
VFDVGWTELVVIACVAILVVGPKDLPRMLRAFGKTMGNVRRIAGDFRRQFDEAMRESELADMAKTASSATKSFQPLEEARKAMADAQKSIRDSVENEARSIEAAAGPVAPPETATPATGASASEARRQPEPLAEPAVETKTGSEERPKPNGVGKVGAP